MGRQSGWTATAGRPAVRKRNRQKDIRVYRGQIPSPGRPSVAWRADRVRFWAAIARGAKTEEACVEAGVSAPVGFSWFRHAGGVNPLLPPTVTGRYSLSPNERTLRSSTPKNSVCGRSLGVWGGPLDDLARAPSQRVDENLSTRLQGDDRSVARRTSSSSSEGGQVVGNDKLHDYVQERLSGGSKGPDGRALGPPGSQWSGSNKPHRTDRRWVQGWSPSRYLGGSGSTSPKMRPCASDTRRSIRRSTSKGAAL